MRHGKKINHLSRTSAHRKAMLSNMASSLILHKRIKTTTAKAKALRTYVEPLITKAKDDKTHSRRIVFKYLKNKEAVAELFRDVAEKVSDRPGGYTRILKTGNRLGDNAEMCFIELVDYNENYSLESESKTKSSKRRRRRGGGGKKKQTPDETQVAAETNDQTEEKEGAKTESQSQSEVPKETKAETKSEADNTEAKKEEKEDNKNNTSSEDKEDKKGPGDQEKPKTE
ncbi:MAG: 50S ribosomal protein L17 [Bacteroidales bacterium]